MHYLIMGMFAAVMLVPQLVRWQALPSLVGFLPEMLSGIVILYVLVVGAQRRFELVQSRYWLIFGMIIVVIVCGIFANGVDSGPIFAGMRYYLRAIPFFLLPAVYLFKESQIRQQLRLLLCLGLLQLPIAAFQRITIQQAGRWSGDGVVGTMLISSILSIFLICSVSVLTAMFIRQRISKGPYLILLCLLLAPTTINETKGTLVLLPLALLAAALTSAAPAKRLRIVLLVAGLFISFGSIFSIGYNYTNKNNPYPKPIEQYFTDEETLERYVNKGSEIGSRQPVGRVDGIVVPLKYVAADPARLAFGVGLGNASHSSLGKKFTGAHFPLVGNFIVSSASTFILEIGIIGIGALFIIYWSVLSDARVVARNDTTLFGLIAAGWTGTVLVISLATFYKTIHTFESLSYLFWFFSGLIAARRQQLTRESVSVLRSNRPQ